MALFDSDGSEELEKPRRDEAAIHFQSDVLAEAYLKGLVDWDGNEIMQERITS